MKRTLFTALLSMALAFTTACNTAERDTENQIEDKLKNAQLERVDVDVEDGVAKLEGEVNDDLQRSQAERIARETPGVNNVQSNLRIVYEEGVPGERGLPLPTPSDNQPPASSDYTPGHGSDVPTIEPGTQGNQSNPPSSIDPGTTGQPFVTPGGTPGSGAGTTRDTETQPGPGGSRSGGAQSNRGGRSR